MNTTGKSRKIWYLLLPILATALLFALSNALMYGIYALFLDLLRVSPYQFVKYAYLAETFVGAILIIIFFVIYKRVFRKDTLEAKTPLNAKDSLMSVAAGLGVSGVSFLWILLVEKIPLFSASLAAMDQADAEMSAGGALSVILTAVVVAPLLEELVFRGIVFRSIDKVKQGWIPILISAVIFGAYHMNLVQAVYATGMGIVAAIIYAKTRNLLYPILVHLANNLIGAIQSFVPSGAGNTAINIFTVVMIIPLCYVLYRMLKHKDDERLASGASV